MCTLGTNSTMKSCESVPTLEIIAYNVKIETTMDQMTTDIIHDSLWRRFNLEILVRYVPIMNIPNVQKSIS